MKQTIRSFAFAALAVSSLSACEKTDRSFSILADEASFSQTASYEAVPQKIDILWVIDNSGSMETSQTALTQNLNRFISRFQSQNYDYHMAVTTSDAIFGQFWGDNSLRLLRDGIPGQTSSGHRVITRNTPNLSNVFLVNATQGINGNGDERAFSSFQSVLTYSGNTGFRRADAYLAIIIVSDEDDFSTSDDAYIGNNYNDPRLIPVSTYKSFLDSFAGAGNHSVNTISILDETCRQALANSFAGRIVGQRYNALADSTGGVKTSLCGNFGDNMQLISDTILNKKPAYSSFKLNREPVVGSIIVRVNGNAVPQNGTNGWTYDAQTMTVNFHGSYIPVEGDNVSIAYDPVSMTN